MKSNMPHANRILGLLFLLNTSAVFAQDSIPVVITGKLNDRMNNETSGLAASSSNKGLLYIHNDSGDTSRFFLISPDGTLKAIYTFKGSPAMKRGVLDCEDMATGVGPKARKSYVYIADIGDNGARRKYLTIYRAEEPLLQPSTTVVTGQVDAAPLYLKYPDGPRDAETMMIDPVEKLLYIVSKREDSVRVYTTPLAYKPGDTVILTKRATLFFEGTRKQITAGDISKDGDQVLIKSYSKVYYWRRKGKEPIWKLLMTPPLELPYTQERQGEAIGFTIDGTSYYTISEGVYPPVYYYKIK
jgi:hypothetical protein